MQALTILPAAQFLPGERVIAPAAPRDHNEHLRRGGPGEVTRTSDAGAGDLWIWVRLDGARLDYPFFASLLRKEPTI